MTNKKNKKGWPTVFSSGVGLYGSLQTVYEGITHIGADGGGLRGIYADFLEEAALFLDNKDLKSTAKLYRSLHERWHLLAQAALPDHIAVFKTTKDLLDKRAALNLAQGSDGLEAIKPINATLHDLNSELNPSFPLSEAETWLLFTDIQSHLSGIYQAEKEALAALKMTVDGLS